MSVGRRQKADARWLLPLLCRRGHITKREVGAIRIGASETYVQIPRIAAKKLRDALKRSAGDGEDADVRIEAASGPPARQTTGPSAQPNGTSPTSGGGAGGRSGKRLVGT